MSRSFALGTGSTPCRQPRVLASCRDAVGKALSRGSDVPLIPDMRAESAGMCCRIYVRTPSEAVRTEVHRLSPAIVAMP